jgi:glycerophosphoryl diester phosphodiesterase
MKVLRILVIAAVVVSVSGFAASAKPPEPTLQGRAVLPVATYAPGPPSGSFFSGQTINGISFPLPSQPIQGFSALLAGRRPGEFLAMPDNGFGNKANSRDFLIRAYFIEPDFKTARGGTGSVAVDTANPIQFRDPSNLIGFPIVNQGTYERLLTGADIDPESMQRAKNGDLWMGDEFGPWILHFDAGGVLLDPPFRVPAALVGSPSQTGYLESPSSPFLVGPNSVAGSRGFESMALMPNGKNLYAMLEGATVADTNKDRRYLLEFSIADRAFTGGVWEYRTQPSVTGTQQCCFMADLSALDQHRMVAIERDNGRGAPVPPAAATFSRGVYVIDLRRVEADGFLAKTRAVDLTAIADPNEVSLPAIHPGDVQLGNPFGVACESIEAVHVIDGTRLLLGCDNNFPNTGRNPVLADDNELIVVRVPGLKSLG